jgi:LAS superfamily LD-carboxypeptidase LdcB
MNFKTVRLTILSLFVLSCTNKKQINKKKTAIIDIQNFQRPLLKNKNMNITKDFVLGKFNYHKHIDFLKIETKHSSKAIYLNKTVYKAFVKMFEAAKNDGISLKVISGTRNFNEQKGIWERKWEKYKTLEPLKRAKKILEFSSMPTTSRHHWGTDMDLNNLNNSYFEKSNGKKEYDWLVTNANNFGFYQVYTPKTNGRTGYNLERWHWSYLPLASQYLTFYNKHITYQDIKGFKGSEYAEKAQMIANYVNGVSKPIKLYKMSIKKQLKSIHNSNDYITLSGLIVEKKFISKNGKPTDVKEFYLRCSIQDYFIKFCDSKITKNDIEKLKLGIFDGISVKAKIMKGEWDACPDDDIKPQSRVGTYIIIDKLLK